MHFCILSPTQGLTRYSTMSRTHLCLAQIEDPDYWAFYRSRRQKGDLVILDNGAYEGAYDKALFIDRMMDLLPQVIALPDILMGAWDESMRRGLNFMKEWSGCYNNQWMFIPQAKKGDIMGWVEGLLNALDQGVEWIGLPRALCYGITNDPMMRVRCAEFISKRSPKTRVHALGMFKGSITELDALRESGCVYSCDSNSPVWRGWCGFSLHIPWEEKPVDYYAVAPEVGGHNDMLIIRNLFECGVRDGNLRIGQGSDVQGT